ncbi:MAG: RecX family transcriptional regulator [Erythrobacter sp.]
MVSGKANSSSHGSDCRGGNGDQPVTGNAPADDDVPPARGRKGPRGRRPKPPPRPLDQAALHDLALSYVARFATTAAKLEAYLLRKLRERGSVESEASEASEHGDDGAGRGAIDIPALVSRMIELGYVDDDAYARMRSRDLSARGYGARRIDQALWAAGVDEAARSEHAPAEAARREAAVRMARKRRIGPFARDHGDGAISGHTREDTVARRKAHDKAIAAMLRGGHELAHACFILDAANEREVEEWLAQAEDTAHTARSGDDDEGIDSQW